MRIVTLVFLFSFYCVVAQRSDFKETSFAKADRIAESFKSKRLYELNKITLNLTKDLNTDVEKVRAIYKWICLNIASDFRLYTKNERKRKKYKNDSLKLAAWNSELKRDLFSKLLKRKKTICTGYAYLFKAMCDVIDIENKMVYGFGRTPDIVSFDADYPNHTWNAVKLNNKWYLCDATWAAGTSYPDDNRFIFKYNDGYFLTPPKLFIANHYPIQSEFALLGNNIPTFSEFNKMPLLYGAAYTYLKEHKSPKKMHHTLKKDSVMSFSYQFKSIVDVTKLKFIVSNGPLDRTKKPTIIYKKDYTLLKQKFDKPGFYDVHLYYKDEILATYVFEVEK